MLYPLSYGGFGKGSLDSLARLVLGSSLEVSPLSRQCYYPPLEYAGAEGPVVPRREPAFGPHEASADVVRSVVTKEVLFAAATSHRAPMGQPERRESEASIRGWFARLVRLMNGG
jgi:hypothetical protein